MSAATSDTGRIFRLMAQELRDCEAAGQRVEDIVADLVSAARPDSQVRSKLQELDVLVQRLRDLAAFCQSIGLSSTIDEASLRSALTVLKLDDVRAALSGKDRDGSVDNVVLF